MDTCGDCLGTGLLPDADRSQCPACDGAKNLISMVGFVEVETRCFKCSGQGSYVALRDACKRCLGMGVIAPVVLEVAPEVSLAEFIELERSRLQRMVDHGKKIKMPKVNLTIPKLKLSNPFKKKEKKEEKD